MTMKTFCNQQKVKRFIKKSKNEILHVRRCLSKKMNEKKNLNNEKSKMKWVTEVWRNCNKKMSKTVCSTCKKLSTKKVCWRVKDFFKQKKNTSLSKNAWRKITNSETNAEKRRQTFSSWSYSQIEQSCIFNESFLQLIMLKKTKRNVEIEELLRRKFFAKCWRKQNNKMTFSN